MATLTRDDIKQALKVKHIVCTPLLSENQFGASSLDVRLGTYFILFRPMRRSALNIYEAGADTSPLDFQEELHVGIGHPLFLVPGALVLGSTLEFIKIPGDLCCEVITRSSWGRLGVIIATATWVHPLYRGCLTLEIVNLGSAPVAVSPGERIGQLVFHDVSTPLAEKDVPARKFLAEGLTRPEYSKLFDASERDDVVKRLRNRWHVSKDHADRAKNGS